MAKRRVARRAKSTGSARKRAAASRSGKRPIKKARPGGSASARKRAPAVAARMAKPAAARKPPRPASARKEPASYGQARRSVTARRRLDRNRRTLEEIVPTPPSSLNMNRHGSAVRTGRAEMAESRLEHRGMSPSITGGDVDVDLENAYFSGDEAPGGDNPTPDQDVVDDIGKALGVEYADNEELKAADKVVERDKHRWELDPASSEDYKDRK